MSSHTPGPWVYDSGVFYAQCQLDKNNQTYEYPIAETLSGRPEDEEANARLIAAAPDLLAALEMLLALVETNEARQGFASHQGNVARDAIKKAVGKV
jgi:hypothetical protein